MGNWKTWLFVIVLYLMVRQCGSCIGCSSSSSRERALKEAYETGKEWAVEGHGSYISPELHFTSTYGTPTTEEDIEFYKAYKQEYERGWRAGKVLQNQMNN